MWLNRHKPVLYWVGIVNNPRVLPHFGHFFPARWCVLPLCWSQMMHPIQAYGTEARYTLKRLGETEKKSEMRPLRPAPAPHLPQTPQFSDWAMI